MSVAHGQSSALRSVSWKRVRCACARGLTLLEILLILVVVGILAQIAISSYTSYIERTRVAKAINDIAALSVSITMYQRDNNYYPATLAQVGNVGLVDPWGKPYVYLDLTTVKGNGDSRRDRKLNPLNSDFDLYSMGKDGTSKKQITAKESLDDILRANDGAFVNLASKYGQ